MSAWHIRSRSGLLGWKELGTRVSCLLAKTQNVYLGIERSMSSASPAADVAGVTDVLWRVPAVESGTRLDRFIKRRAPGLPPGLVQRLIRQQRVAINGVPITRNAFAVRGHDVVAFPGDVSIGEVKRVTARAELSDSEVAYIRSCLLYSDPRCAVLNKPAGLSTQGGTGVGSKHVEALLPGLGPGKYWLVHRLDKDVSGTLAVAKDVGAAAKLAEHFRRRGVEKTYWALVKGAVPAHMGSISFDIEGKPSETKYRVVQDLGRFGAWLALRPVTGRKHQLRIHCAEGLKCPIVGETRYGEDAELRGLPSIGPPVQGIAELAHRGLHLHARELSFPKVLLKAQKPPTQTKRAGVPMISVQAPLPEHMKSSWNRFGLQVSQGNDVDWTRT